MAEHYGDGNENSKVEIATLVLPSEAVGDGLQAGDGTEVVLEAAPVTLERLVVEQPNGGQQANAYSTAATTEPNTTIEAVIDLNAVCENISGMMPKEFVEMLHRDHAAAMEEYGKEPSMEETKDKTDLEVAFEQPTDENTPLLQNKTEEIELIEGAALHLSADPFLRTLADVLPSSPLDPETTKVETTFDEEENHLSHEAFLIRAVAPDNQRIEGLKKENDVAEDTFILALPQVRAHGGSRPSGDASRGVGIFTPLIERAMSELPTDVQHIEFHAKMVQVEPEPLDEGGVKYKDGELDTKEIREEIHLDLVVERKVPVIGIVILMFSLFSSASIGVALKLQGGGVAPLTKSHWRLQATSICIFPMAVRKLNRAELSKFTRDDWLIFPVGAMCYSFVVAGFVVGLSMTSLANAFILSNLGSVIIIFAKLVLGMPVLFLEIMGALIALTGSVICAVAKVPSRSSDQPERMLLEGTDTENAVMRAYHGDAICFATSFAMASYLVIAGRLRNKMDLFVFMFLLFVTVLIFLSLTILVSDESVTFSRHPVHGIFGWMNLTPDRLPLELWMAIICNIVGATGYVAVLKYFEPVVVSVVMLAGPVVAALQGAAAGVAPLPGLQTWIGDGLVVLGSVIVILSGLKKTEHVDINLSDVAAAPKIPTELLSPVVSVNTDKTKAALRASNVLQNGKNDYQDDFAPSGNTKRDRALSDDLRGKRIVFE